MSKMIVFDVSNFLWKTRHTCGLNEKKHEEFAPQLLTHNFIRGVNQIYKKFNGTGAMLAFEGKGNWRKKVYPDYKNKEMDDIYYDDVKEALDLIRDFFDNHTSVKTVAAPMAEADDTIALYAQKKSEDLEVVIISSDRDFVQLLEYPKVSLYSPQQEKFRECDDPQFELFLKCIRGDTSDNIMSAYPRVRKTKLEQAFYGDSLQMIELMETVNKTGDKVGERYDFNRMLIDLKRQPEEIREKIEEQLLLPVNSRYSLPEALKFCKEKKLIKIGSELMGGDYTNFFGGTFKFQ